MWCGNICLGVENMKDFKILGFLNDMGKPGISTLEVTNDNFHAVHCLELFILPF